MNYLCIKNGKVVNVIVADQEFLRHVIPSVYDECLDRDKIALVENERPDIGWKYANKKFHKPDKE